METSGITLTPARLTRFPFNDALLTSVLKPQYLGESWDDETEQEISIAALMIACKCDCFQCSWSRHCGWKKSGCHFEEDSKPNGRANIRVRGG